MPTAIVQSLGEVVVVECGGLGCSALFAFKRADFDRVQRTHETFYCTNGHARHYPPKPNDAQRANAEIERQRQAADAERRLREEAERRAADQERERLRVQRELVESRRTTRRALKVAAHVVSEEKKARGGARRKGARR